MYHDSVAGSCHLLLCLRHKNSCTSPGQATSSYRLRHVAKLGLFYQALIYGFILGLLNHKLCRPNIWYIYILCRVSLGRYLREVSRGLNVLTCGDFETGTKKLLTIDSEETIKIRDRAEYLRRIGLEGAIRL